MTEKFHFRNNKSAYHVNREVLLKTPEGSFFRKLYEYKVDWDEVADYCSFYRKNGDMHVFINISPGMFKIIMQMSGIICPDINHAVNYMLTYGDELLKIMKIFGIENNDLIEMYKKKLDQYNQLFESLKKIIIFIGEQYNVTIPIEKLTYSSSFYIMLRDVDYVIIESLCSILAITMNDIDSKETIIALCNILEKITVPHNVEFIKKTIIRILHGDIYDNGRISVDKMQKSVLPEIFNLYLKNNF